MEELARFGTFHNGMLWRFVKYLWIKYSCHDVESWYYITISHLHHIFLNGTSTSWLWNIADVSAPSWWGQRGNSWNRQSLNWLNVRTAFEWSNFVKRRKIISKNGMMILWCVGTFLDFEDKVGYFIQMPNTSEMFIDFLPFFIIIKLGDSNAQASLVEKKHLLHWCYCIVTLIHSYFQRPTCFHFQWCGTRIKKLFWSTAPGEVRCSPIQTEGSSDTWSFNWVGSGSVGSHVSCDCYICAMLQLMSIVFEVHPWVQHTRISPCIFHGKLGYNPLAIATSTFG